jgi:hypothetical protein
MGVSLEIYSAAIGLFNGKIFYISKVFKPFSLLKLQCGCLFVLVTLLGLLILLCGNVEINAGPSNNLFLNIGHTNARSLQSGAGCSKAG